MKKAQVSLSTKIHLPLIASLVIGTIFVVVLSIFAINTIEKDTYQTQCGNNKVYLKNTVGSKFDIALSNTISISNARNVEEIAVSTESLHATSYKLQKKLEQFQA
jgi:hypothetical protein